MSTRDPDGKDQHTSGAKMDADKLDLSLFELLGDALEEVCRVMDYGQTKYTRGGFLEVPDAVRRYTSAMLRHWLKERKEKYDSGDPFYDTEEGLPFKGTIRHDAQVAVNALFRLQCKLEEERCANDELEACLAEWKALKSLDHIYTDDAGVDHVLDENNSDFYADQGM